MKIFLATQPQPDFTQGPTLTKMGGQKRLMSYFYLKNCEREFLPKYVQHGQVRRANENKNK